MNSSVRLRLWLVMGVVAFLGNMLLPFAASYGLGMASAQETMQRSDYPDFFGDSLLICTSEGYKWITRAEMETGGAPDAGEHYACGLCFIAAHGLADLVGHDDVMPVMHRSARSGEQYGQHIHRRDIMSPRLQPFMRAPPAFG